MSAMTMMSGVEKLDRRPEFLAEVREEAIPRGYRRQQQELEEALARRAADEASEPGADYME